MSKKQQLLLQGTTETSRYTLYGKSFVCNNVLNKTNCLPISKETKGLNIINNNDGSFNINGTATSSYFETFTTYPFVAGKKYVIIHNYSDDIEHNLQTWFYGFRIASGYGGFEDDIYTADNNYIGFAIRVNSGVTLANEKTMPLCICITDIEQQLGITINTLDDFYATDFGRAIKNGFVPEYSLTNKTYNTTGPFTCSGDNLWQYGSFELKNKKYESVTLEEPLPAGTYTFSANVETVSNSVRISFRKEDGTAAVSFYLNLKDGKGSQIMTLNTSAYSVFLYGSNVVTAEVDAKFSNIMLTEGSIPREYVPYTHIIVDENIELKSAGNVKDIWRTWNGELTKNVGTVDLSNYTVGYQQSANRFYVNGINIKNKGYVRLLDVLCSKYATSTSEGNNTLFHYGDQIYIYDNAYTDPVIFKQTLVGVYLNYELAHPETSYTESYRMPNTITKIVDANRVEVEFEKEN